VLVIDVFVMGDRGKCEGAYANNSYRPLTALNIALTAVGYEKGGRNEDLNRIDLHVHSRLSKSFDYDHANLERLVRVGRRRGLNAFALTEHIHAVNFWEMHNWLLDNFEYEDGAYRIADDFTVLSGAEVTVAERVDFIVVGPLDRLASLDNAFRPRLSEWNHAPALEFAQAARDHGMVLVLAHPFRVGKEAAKLDERIFDLVHAVEVNGRDHGGERQVVALAEKHDLPLSGGSDAHFYLQVGIRSTIVPRDEVHYEAIRESFEARRTRVHAKPYARPVVEFCQEVKRVAKWQGAAEEAVA
jgi:histidinol phosphatase-like PHP family hydrolase